MSIEPASLVAIEEIKQLKARYFRFMDMQDWQALGTVFAPDAYYDATDALRDGCSPATIAQKGGPEWINTGREAIVAFIRGALEGCVSAHHGQMPEISILSATEATGIWPMHDVVRKHVGGRLVLRLDGEGHYWETYRKVDNEWVIQTSRLSRLRTDFWQATD